VAVTVEQNERGCLLRLEGDVNIFMAAELKTALLKAVRSGREVRVNLEGVGEVDVTALQLLWAAERAARAAGGTFSLAGGLPQEVAAALREAGLESFPAGM
jgi:anti-anti-sigma factor